MKYDLKWAREHRRFLTDPDLIGWLWPWHYHRILAILKRDDPKWIERNAHRILPYQPMRESEWLHPDAQELLV